VAGNEESNAVRAFYFFRHARPCSPVPIPAGIANKDGNAPQNEKENKKYTNP